MPEFDPQEDFEEDMASPSSAPSPQPSQEDTANPDTWLDFGGPMAQPDDRPVAIPFDDIQRPITQTDQVSDVLAERERLAQDAAAKMEVWSRSSEKRQGESDEAHQERIKVEFTEAVQAARRQDEAPPPPKQPVPRAIAKQTELEMAAGQRQTEYWKEQQKQRPLPTAKEIQAAGTNTQVFRPGEYAHERGGVDKQLVTSQAPVR